MPIHLPDVVREYFEADKSSNPDAIAQCFAEDAVVIDEGNTYTGREAIRQWMANASTQYTYTVKPIAIAPEHGRIVVTGHLAGNFPGSPVDLRYIFAFADDKIARLEIVP
ncbi:MAG: nuclear transport factor 2 family protein [Erythrobacter sp.]|jgi:uncharacterized protein (TIGR02246 family)|uniref:nuclear transport factor 2 family protein n=1 Tax=Qipengyuania TaxID=1855416 RepID=UPI001A5AF1F2|nr:nuclear transport factor 2 family protein [Qipengyuania citrea]MBL4717972.1 nuclear transport factor 2 family protein [Erythrobacter sp.]MCP2017076.1 uncharacterized protein (TIGR02246 family) [Qipengyuania citrea]MDE0901119.1 nuclear transport factor 2 family protein [Erythrobacter sp.]|tara:strand:+ start:1191 stop:1520 length:330 start_codon:yes stop_codon:yes gene_type:complete